MVHVVLHEIVFPRLNKNVVDALIFQEILELRAPKDGRAYLLRLSVKHRLLSNSLLLPVR